jgi:hypothetical protein
LVVSTAFSCKHFLLLQARGLQRMIDLFPCNFELYRTNGRPFFTPSIALYRTIGSPFFTPSISPCSTH